MRNAFAGINWIAISVGATALAWTVNQVGGSRKQAVCVGLLLLLSVPTFWYASYPLTDPGAICARALFVVGVVSGQPWRTLGAGLGAAAGWSHAPASLAPLKCLMRLMALPPLYAALSVRVDGRAIWGLYPFLIPFAVYARLPWARRQP